jgi:hypothetical protein
MVMLINILRPLVKKKKEIKEKNYVEKYIFKILRYRIHYFKIIFSHLVS